MVKAVFRSQNKPGILCEEQPMRVQYNAVFLINLKHVPMKDLVADGNGTFTNTGQPTHTIEICSDEDESENEDEKMSYPQVKVLARAKRPLKCKSQFLLQRYYYRHSKQTSFHRIISLLRNKEGEIHGDVAVLQYQWEGEEGEVTLAPHGNSKRNSIPYQWEGEEGEVTLAPHGNSKRNSIPFTATKSSVKQKLEYNLGRHQVREAIDLTEGEFGRSIFDAKSPAEHVRSTHQGHYAARKIRARAGTGNKHKKEWDELYSLMTVAKEDDHDFIRAIVNHP